MTAVVDLDTRRAARDELARYLRLGWHVFPVYEVEDGRCSCTSGRQCGSPGKHPRLGRQYEPSNDTQQVAKWWRTWPNANIGCCPGPSDMIVLDIDPRNGGDETLLAMEQANGELPDCPTALTGGGGLHLWFKRPSSMVTCSSAVLGPGVELKADTGYVVMPPSMHISGVRYAWDVGRHIDDTEAPELPEWICRLLVSRRGIEPLPSDPRGPAAGLMGAAFAAAGWTGHALGRDKVAVLCPFRGDHTTGKDLDGSTVVFAPQMGRRGGWFHCSHAHCAGLKQNEVLDALPPNAVAAAKRLLGVDQEYGEPSAAPKAEGGEELTDSSWKRSLKFNSKLCLTNDIGNAVLLLTHDPVWKKALRYDNFHERMMWGEAPPLAGWRLPAPGSHFNDDSLSYIHHWFVISRGVRFSLQNVAAAVRSAARQQAHDTLTEWLDGLTWDGKPRVGTWTHDFLGAPPVPYTAFVGRAWMVSAVARAFKPGVQADHMLILEGPQGNRKTSALEALAGEWLLRDMPDLRNKDALVNLCGKWIVNFEELAGLSKQDWTRIKAFLTQRVDTFRPPYGAVSIDRPRRCVFSGTSNRDDYLSDETGGRRFWPVKCTTINADGIAAIRDQLWAEAVHLFQKKESWWAQNPGMEADVAAEQSLRSDTDPWEPEVYRAITGDPDRAWRISELLGGILGIEPGRQDHKHAQRVGKILRRAGYYRFRAGDGTWAWRVTGSAAKPFPRVPEDDPFS